MTPFLINDRTTEKRVFSILRIVGGKMFRRNGGLDKALENDVLTLISPAKDACIHRTFRCLKPSQRTTENGDDFTCLVVDITQRCNASLGDPWTILAAAV